jgi:2-polyprenyl-3-methyl-5-hydroxy-6-metoxy-1,4-benzoquinol methylase
MLFHAVNSGKFVWRDTMQDRHQNNEQYFKEQGVTTQKHVIPYLIRAGAIPSLFPNEIFRILEIGCGEGGNLAPFLELDAVQVVGIDYAQSRIERAENYYQSHPNRQRLQLIHADIYTCSEEIGKFDLIIMRDVIEHIHNQERFMGFVKQFMKPETVFFLAFPPWQNPFGGHQQICKNRLLSKMPFFHLLPTFLYRTVLRWGKESSKTIEDLLEIKETGISLERFERIVAREHYAVQQRTLFFINPNYETKFGLKPRVQWRWLSSIPWIRNFFVTAGYYCLRLQNTERE